MTGLLWDSAGALDMKNSLIPILGRYVLDELFENRKRRNSVVKSPSRLPARASGGGGIPPQWHDIYKSFKPAYRYANGVQSAYFHKVDIWRNTGQPAGFYQSQMDAADGAYLERYVWIFHNGRFTEVAQFGVRGSRRQFVG
ncbi:hypothetical protein ACSBOB_20255 [Mesorhizobium sp. ASY16-5R]|uniref:hypothetical protein n=1 Tax=Mesorhizobium sp. ASY16-5R TaxID=3445772 RepID=UPI003FA14737